MTVLLVLFTLILFLSIDYLIQRKRSSTPVTHAASIRLKIDPMILPNDLDLAVNHVWVRNDRQGTATIGLDEFLAGLFGTVESILLPKDGAMVTPVTAEFTLRKGGKALELCSPLVGRVLEVNEHVLKTPSLAHLDPYGKGWLVKVKPKPDRNTLYGSFLVSRPAEWLKEQSDQAKEFFATHSASGQLATMQDGGVPVDGLLQYFDDEVWRDFSAKFASLHRISAM